MVTSARRVLAEAKAVALGLVEAGWTPVIGPGPRLPRTKLLPREVDAAIDLLALPNNHARVRHFLATNKPLRN